jgi:hypothetical protein
LSSNVSSEAIQWKEEGVEYSIVGGYLGEMFAPINTLDAQGGYIDPGQRIYGLALLLDIRNATPMDVCAPLSLSRVVDETGRKVEPNTAKFFFGFADGGCTLPAQTQTQFKVIFIAEPGERDFIIEGPNGVFVVTYDEDENVVRFETTVPLG